VAGVALEAPLVGVEEWDVHVGPAAEGAPGELPLVVPAAVEPGQLSARSGVQTPTLRWPKNATQLVQTIGELSR